MKSKFYLVVVLMVGSFALAQSKKVDKQTAAIVEEGKKLYHSEMASWYGSDIFMEKFAEKRGRIGGYFSYTEGETAKCVFYSNDDKPKTLGTIIFDSTYDVKTAKVEGDERELSSYEMQLQLLRTKALEEVRSDTLFVTYKNTNLNLIPIIDKNEKKVYILTGPTKNGVIIFGNDYLLTFDKMNRVISKKKLHKSMIPMEYKNSVSGVHSHLSSTGDFITATDICTLMLYERFTGWDNYMVMSKDYVSIWDCKKDSLLVLTSEAFSKMSNDGKDDKD